MKVDGPLHFLKDILLIESIFVQLLVSTSLGGESEAKRVNYI